MILLPEPSRTQITGQHRHIWFGCCNWCVVSARSYALSVNMEGRELRQRRTVTAGPVSGMDTALQRGSEPLCPRSWNCFCVAPTSPSTPTSIAVLQSEQRHSSSGQGCFGVPWGPCLAHPTACKARDGARFPLGRCLIGLTLPSVRSLKEACSALFFRDDNGDFIAARGYCGRCSLANQLTALKGPPAVTPAMPITAQHLFVHKTCFQ